MTEENKKAGQNYKEEGSKKTEVTDEIDKYSTELQVLEVQNAAFELRAEPLAQKKMDSLYIPFEFTGKAKEFFGIWLLNLLLSILTLGIYSAWAKVRRHKFFLGHTLMGGHRFDYHADPKVILRGRAVVVSMLVVWSLVSELSLVLSGISLILLMQMR